MIEALKGIGTRVINHQRHHYFILKREGEGRPSVIWLPGVIISRTGNQSQGNYKRVVKSRFRVSSPFFGIWFAAMLLWSVLPTGTGVFAVPLALPIALVPLLGVIRGRRDYKDFKHTRRLAENPTPEAATEATAYLDGYQADTRISALQTILPVCEGSPGKLVKHIDQDLSDFADQLVTLLEDENPEVRKLSAAVIKWFTRDYGDKFGPHAKVMSGKLKSPDSDVQADLAIALGNIGARADNQSNFAEVLAPAVKDEDPDVREAAAYALERLPCQQSAKMLKYLAEDSSPSVSEQARASLQALTA